MSVSHGILCLLGEHPQHGYQLRLEFEAVTGGTWPLNVGQVYTTLGRLERDGLVEPDGATDASGRNAYRITDTGRTALATWFVDPVRRDGNAREELVAKIALAIATPSVDTHEVVLTQRAATLEAMRSLTTRKRTSEDAAERLVLDSQLFHAEAEVRWLDHCLEQLPPDTEADTPTTTSYTPKDPS